MATAHRPRPNVSPARSCAYSVVRRVFEQGAYADRALHAEAVTLDPRDRALATNLAYGTIQRCGTLDHIAARLSDRAPDRLDAPVLAALRLGLFQLLYLDGVAEHAAVNESVELAKRAHRGGASFVNAVLRRAAREGPTLLAELSDETPDGAALVHSVPRWLAEKWWVELGSTQTRSLLAKLNEPAESALRINELCTTRDQVAASLPVPAHPAAELPEALILDAAFDAHGHELFAAGAIMPQSRGSMLVGRTLAPQPGERVLDLCAAPGGKTTHLAALMHDQGEVVAVERHPGRAQALRRTAARMHATCVRVEQADAATPRGVGSFDRVLVDPPCSGLGTLQSRPDVRWRASVRSIVELAELQRRILEAAAASTAPAGTLVYSVCTISSQEGEGVIDAFLHHHPEFSVVGVRQLLPHTDGTDGFFIAELRRRTARAARYPSSGS